MPADLTAADLIVALVNAWPTLSAALTEMRRKANAFDEIREHIECVAGDYRIKATFCYPHESHAAIEAALHGQKETT